MTFNDEDRKKIEYDMQPFTRLEILGVLFVGLALGLLVGYFVF